MPKSATTIEPAPWVELDRCVEAFEAARTGNDDLQAFAPPHGDPLRLTVLRELVRVDLELGWAEGRPRRLADYRRDYSELFHDAESIAAIAFEEYRLRGDAGERPDVAEYAPLGVDTADWPPPPNGSASSSSAAPAHAELLRALQESDPNAAERFARAAAAWPRPGDEFLGFRLERELGRGAFGRVFLARQGELADRPVALKVVGDVFGEPQRLARLQHANIVPVHSVHQAGPFTAICMPYVGGATLAAVIDHLRMQPTPPTKAAAFAVALNALETNGAQDSNLTGQPGSVSYVAEVLRLAERLADGLAHAHERGVLHRDIKPANVLLTADGRPMLLDFNLAADAASPAEAAAAYAAGTLPYMAPEALARLSGGPGGADAGGDIYALGIVIWELMTCRTPFPERSGSLADVLPPMIADRRTPPPTRDLNPAVSPATAAIIAKCLDPDPTRRYSTARHLQDDLRRQLDDRPLLHVREPSVMERLRKWRRRHPRLAVGFVTAAAIVPLAFAYVARGRALTAAEDAATRDGFAREKRLGQMLLTLPNLPATERAAGAAAAEAALARYGAFDGPSSAALRRLPLELRSRIGREIGELLLTYSLYGGGSHPPDRLRALAEAHLAVSGTTNRDLFGSRAAVQNDLSKGRYRDALTRLAAECRRDPRDALVWLARGDCHAALGEYEPAIGCYHTALALTPDFYRGYYHRGLAYLQLRRPDEAIADFDAALQLKPDFLPALMQRGVANADSGDFTAAVRDLESARAAPDAPTQVDFMLAKVFDRFDRPAEAAAARAAGFRRDPGDELDACARGLARVGTDPIGALADFERAESFNPHFLPAIRNQASILANMPNRADDAIRVLTRTLAIDPDAVADRASRGVLLARIGQRAAAHADAIAALKLDGKPFHRYQVAGIYSLTSRTHPDDASEALRLLGAALEKGVGLDFIDDDRDLDAIRGRPEFAKIVTAARILHAAVVAGKDGS